MLKDSFHPMRELNQQFSVKYSFPVHFTKKVFTENNGLLASVLQQAGRKCHRVFCVIDSGVYEHHPMLCEQIEKYGAAYRETMQICGHPLIVHGGESCKTRPDTIDTIITQIKDLHLCRQSFVMAIGGGAVLDAVGYAAAVVHRGIRLIRMPTTVLGQNDAGVGVKNGINAFGRKNFIGTFAPPFAVINDFSFLDTLPEREIRAGMAEAVKVALIKDESFFEYLFNSRKNLACFEQNELEELIFRCAAFHVHHIGTQGDPFEFGSSRPLDFGHWAAHKLEELTGNTLNHGEAVSIGIALDSLYSQRYGLLMEEDLDRILGLLIELGLPIYHPAMCMMDVPLALDEFREHLGGVLAITLLTGIGTKKEVDSIDTDLMRSCINELAELHHSPDMTTRRDTFSWAELN